MSSSLYRRCCAVDVLIAGYHWQSLWLYCVLLLLYVRLRRFWHVFYIDGRKMRGKRITNGFNSRWSISSSTCGMNANKSAFTFTLEEQHVDKIRSDSRCNASSAQWEKESKKSNHFKRIRCLDLTDGQLRWVRIYCQEVRNKLAHECEICIFMLFAMPA